MALKLGLNRILKEINEVNSQFQNLRTYIVPDPKHVRADLFYFVMYPADGSLADRPVVGKMFLPSRYASYPENPPIIHVFTKTQRYNVDIFNRGDDSYMEMSSMCFDILNKKTSYGEGIWEQNFTLSAVFASLLQVLVEYQVKQQYMPSYEKIEAVSMEKMAIQHQEINKIWSKYKSYFPNCPKIIRTKAKKVSVYRPIEFQSNEIIVSNRKSSRIHTSNPFWLSKADFSVVIDLTDFRKKLTVEKQLYNFVVSIVLSNSPRDPFGRRDDTILVRDGITATAAKKLAGEEMRWFYHGKPLTDFQKVRVTVAHKQITLVVEKEESKQQECLIFGDTVLSYLTEAELGNFMHGRQFYLLIYVETKKDLEFLTENEKIKLIRDPICIRLETDNKFGYIHPSDRYNTTTRYESQNPQPFCLHRNPIKIIETETKNELTEESHQSQSDDDKPNATAVVTNNIEPPSSPVPSDESIQSDSAIESEGLRVDISRMVIRDFLHYSYLTDIISAYKTSKQNTNRSEGVQVELDTRLITQLEFFLNDWESANKKVIKEAMKNFDYSTMETQFSTALRINDTKTESIVTSDNSNASSKTNSITESVGQNSSGVGSSVESLVDNVTKVTIYLSKSSKLIYKDILGSQDMLKLLDNYEKVINPGHIVLCHRNDFFYHDEFDTFLKQYTEDQIVEFQVKGVVYDDVALVLLIDAEQTKPKTPYMKTQYRKNIVVTIAINGNSQLTYGNNLVDTASKKAKTNKVKVSYFDEPVKCLGQIKFHRKASC